MKKPRGRAWSHNRSIHKQETLLALKLDSLAFGGEAVGRWNGKAIFVPFGAPGEVADVRLVEDHRRFARAEMIRVVNPSPERVLPFCPHFTRCGGCQLQHLRYEAQLAVKRRFVVDALQRIAGLTDIDVRPVVPCPQSVQMRNRAVYVFGWSRGQPRSGFYAPRSHAVIDVGMCPVQMDPNNQALQIALDLIHNGSLSVFNPRTGRGVLRWLEVFSSSAGDQSLVTLIATQQSFDRDAVVEAFRDAMPGLQGLLLRGVRPARGDSPTGDQHYDTERQPAPGEVLCGQPHMEETVCGLRFRVSAGSFWQSNPALLPALMQSVIDSAGLEGGETVCDLYSGVGLFASALSGGADSVVAVEMSPQAVQDAVASFQMNGLRNIEQVRGEVEATVKAWNGTRRRFDVLLLDPPRRGASGAIPQIAELAPSRIVYVSCDPATLARDLKGLTAAGYHVRFVQPLDMFPQTYHVECVTLLTRPEGRQ